MGVGEREIHNEILSCLGCPHSPEIPRTISALNDHQNSRSKILKKLTMIGYEELLSDTLINCLYNLSAFFFSLCFEKTKMKVLPFVFVSAKKYLNPVFCVNKPGK